MSTKSVCSFGFVAVLALVLFTPSPWAHAQGCTAHFEILKGLTGLDSGFEARPA